MRRIRQCPVLKSQKFLVIFLITLAIHVKCEDQNSPERIEGSREPRNIFNTLLGGRMKADFNLIGTQRPLHPYRRAHYDTHGRIPPGRRPPPFKLSRPRPHPPHPEEQQQVASSQINKVYTFIPTPPDTQDVQLNYAPPPVSKNPPKSGGSGHENPKFRRSHYRGRIIAGNHIHHNFGRDSPPPQQEQQQRPPPEQWYTPGETQNGSTESTPPDVGQMTPQSDVMLMEESQQQQIFQQPQEKSQQQQQKKNPLVMTSSTLPLPISLNGTDGTNSVVQVKVNDMYPSHGSMIGKVTSYLKQFLPFSMPWTSPSEPLNKDIKNSIHIQMTDGSQLSMHL